MVALPVGKIIGISLFGWIAMRIRPKGADPALPFADILAAGALGGIGFTVSLLLANLAFASDGGIRDQAILGVLVGSLIALVLIRVHRVAAGTLVPSGRIRLVVSADPTDRRRSRELAAPRLSPVLTGKTRSHRRRHHARGPRPLRVVAADHAPRPSCRI